ncbi:MAG: hypothetical protein KAI22_03235, partial [Gammaproteobacteria bacterium]|nr:hypothetical protein [Gammaproteobacteria bacterium]
MLEILSENRDLSALVKEEESMLSAIHSYGRDVACNVSTYAYHPGGRYVTVETRHALSLQFGKVRIFVKSHNS